jgi:hypothetical protein
MPDAAGLWQVTKNTSKQELPEMDQALPEEQSPPSEKVKDTGNSKSGTKRQWLRVTHLRKKTTQVNPQVKFLADTGSC